MQPRIALAFDHEPICGARLAAARRAAAPMQSVLRLLAEKVHPGFPQVEHRMRSK